MKMADEMAARAEAAKFMVLILVRNGLRSGGGDQTIMPGPTLVAIRMTEQTVARAVARMFMMVVLSNMG
ncbi:hypothetical protein [Blastomonas sp. SL216]|uniref:hypothetical protein n=1 Tax=Blastomonas sp. SL216 TaxID=2995169 RepID=UPI0023771919|nr:hypothetical protein OU999_14830 [Blastomonas sp. SL216]